MKFRNLYSKFVGVCITCTALAGHSQAVLQTLHGQVRTEVARGKAIPQSLMQPDQQMHLSIVLPLRNQAELKSLLGRLYDPSSPDFHKFLTAEQFTEQFAPTVSDYQSVVSYAQANGFTVGDVPANRLVVPITGTVAQVQKTFSVRMALYQHPTENRQFFSPDRDPSLNLSVPVAHIAGLDNYSVPKPMYNRAEPLGKIHYVTEGSGPGGSFLASDMRWAYYGGTALTGAGQTIALLEFDGYSKSDVDLTFSSVGDSYTVPIQNVLLNGATGANMSGNDSEEVLDIVQAIGMAPGLSQVRVYIGGNDVDILNSIASENLAQEVSISWSWSPDNPDTDDIFFQEMAAQGQSVFAASGDWGEFDPYFDNFFPAEDQFVTAVGGTDLSTQGGGGPWASETAWTRSGGGVSPDGIPIPAWQAGIATSTNGGSNTLRNVPDVAMQADFVNYSCANGSCAGNYGGTSFSAPRWAAFMALVNEQAVTSGNSTLGFINPAIYAIGEGSNYGNDFHDIDYGNNNARNNCCGWPYYNAVDGYDLVTGWGSPNGQSLIDDLAPPTAASFVLAPASTVLNIVPGNSGNINIAIQDKSGFSGSVTLAAANLPTGVTAAWGTNPATSSSTLTVNVDSSVPRGSYLITVNGTSGSLTASTTFVLQIAAPGFGLAPSPASVSLYPGTSTSATILVTDYSGFNGSVNLAVTSGLPSGVTASWASNPATGSALLTLTADSTAVPNTDAILTIVGTSGSLTATTTLALIVNPPTFYVNVSPYPSTIVQGGSVTTTVTVTGVPANRATDTITLSAPELPAGITASFSPTTIQLGQSSTLTLTASASAPTGTNLVGIEANGTATDTVSQFPITVTASASPAFTLAVAQSAPTVVQGNSVSDSVTVTPQNGFNSSVALAISPGTPLPSGVTTSFSPGSTTGSSQLTFTASDTAVAGFYTLQIVGTSGSLTAVANVFLTVNPPALFSLSASPASLSVSQYGSTTDSITVNAQSGFLGSVNLSILSALPAGITASFAPSATTGSSTLTVAASGSAVPGNYILTIAGTTAGHTITTFLPLTVTPNTAVPTVTTIAINPSGSSLAVGSTFTLTATVVEQAGSATPAGNVIFYVGAAQYTAALNASGIATCVATAPNVTGMLTIYAAYQGSTSFAPSTSSTLNESVVTIATSTNLSINPNSGTLLVGSSYTLTAKVTPSTGTTAPTGSLMFTIGSVTQVVALDGTGTATYAGTAPLTAGTLSISASYLGATQFTPSSSATLSEQIVLTGTSTMLTISPNSSSLASSSAYTLTATVAALSGTTTPAGSVVFTIGSVTQTVALDASGTATYATTAPATAGTLTISATYQGQGDFATSTSNTLNETIYAAASQTFALSGTAVSIAAGASTGNTSTITITPNGGFTGAVSLSASISSGPSNAQYAPSLSFTANPVNLNSSSPATVQLIIATTPASTTAANTPVPERTGFHLYASGGAALACLLLFGIPARRRSWQRFLALIVLVAALASGAVGCGGASIVSNPNPPSVGTTPGTYLIAVKGVSGATTATATVSLTVQ